MLPYGNQGYSGIAVKVWKAWIETEYHSGYSLHNAPVSLFAVSSQLLVFTYHVIKPKNRNHSIN